MLWLCHAVVVLCSLLNDFIISLYHVVLFSSSFQLTCSFAFLFVFVIVIVFSNIFLSLFLFYCK